MKRRTVLIGAGAVVAAIGVGSGLEFVRAGSAADYAAATAAMRRELAGLPELAELVRFAALAANGHNSQPWRFRLDADAIDILPDPTRRTPAVDPDDHHLFVSLGCAAANLALAAEASGRPGELSFDPSGEDLIRFAFAAGSARPSALSAAIPRRQSTRAAYGERRVDAADLATLRAAAARPGVELTLLTERGPIAALRDLILAANAAQMADPAFVAELKAWLRFSPRRALAAGDGLYGGASGNPALPDWLGSALFDLVFTTAAENARYAKMLDASAGIAVFTGERADPAHWIGVGQAAPRFALQATALGLRTAFVNQPVEVVAFRPALAALIGAGDRRPDLVMRFGYGPTLPYSARRPVGAILV